MTAATAIPMAVASPTAAMPPFGEAVFAVVQEAAASPLQHPDLQVFPSQTPSLSTVALQTAEEAPPVFAAKAGDGDRSRRPAANPHSNVKNI